MKKSVMWQPMIMGYFLSQVMNSATQLVQDFDSLASGQ